MSKLIIPEGHSVVLSYTDHDSGVGYATDRAAPIDMSNYSDPYDTLAQIVGDYKLSQEVAFTASDRKQRYEWLPFAAEAYKISDDIGNFVLVPVTIMNSDLPNRNLVGFPFEQITAWNMQTCSINYQTFKGVPLHLDHCFPAEAPVLTPHGERPIASLKAGDYVVTAKGRNRRVKRLFKNGVKKVREIDIVGYPESMLTTDNHPLFVADARQVYNHVQSTLGSFGPKNSGLRGLKDERSIRVHQRPASDVYPGDYLCVPRKVFGGKRTENPALCFLVGLYAAEGSLNRKGNYRTVNLTLGAKETALRDEVVAACDSLGYDHAVYYRDAVGKGGSISPSVCNVSIKSRTFHDLCKEAIGIGSADKAFGPWVRNLDRESLLRFIGGYLSGDGYLRAGGIREKSRKGSSSTIILTTVSRQMAADLFYAYISLGMSPMFMNSADEHTVNGFGHGGKYGDKVYDCAKSYHVKVSREDVKELWPYLTKSKTKGKKFFLAANGAIARHVLHSFWHNNTYFMRVRDVTPDVKRVPVYNIEVEEDHTYITYGVSVHNCNTDPTIAKGIVFDVGLRKVPKVAGNLWRIVTLCGADRKRDGRVAGKIMSGEIDSYSMGAFVKGYECSICHAKTDKPSSPRCAHIPPNRKQLKTYQVQGKPELAYWKCGPFKGFEVSALTKGGMAPGAFPTTDNTPAGFVIGEPTRDER